MYAQGSTQKPIRHLMVAANELGRQRRSQVASTLEASPHPDPRVSERRTVVLDAQKEHPATTFAVDNLWVRREEMIGAEGAVQSTCNG